MIAIIISVHVLVMILTLLCLSIIIILIVIVIVITVVIICMFFPSIFEWDLTNGPLSKLVELLDTQVFSGSVQWVLLEMSWIFMLKHSQHMGVSKNGGTPKSSILTGFSIINYKPSIFGVALFLGNIHIVIPLCGNRITILLGKKSPHPARMPQSKRTAMVLLSIGLGCSGGLSEAKVEVRCLALGGSWFGCFHK